MNETIYINGTDVKSLGAESMRAYGVGGTALENDYFQGRNRTNFTLLSAVFKLKPIWFQLVFKADTRHDAMQQKSNVDALLYGTSEIFLPDGYYYRAMLESIGEIEWQGQDGAGMLAIVKYSMNGMQHDPLVTVTGASFYAAGTTPQMDASLTVKVSTAAASYNLGGAVFENVAAGDVLTFDGIYKRTLKNGAPATATGWINFPVVTPGPNSLTAADPVTVQYYPCYL